MSNFEDLLRPYYSRIFPYEPYIKWLNGGSVTQSGTNCIKIGLPEN